jgi:Flp pilus assembly protein CpaB
MRKIALVLLTAGVMSAGLASVFAAAAAADQQGPVTSDSVRITNRDF